MLTLATLSNRLLALCPTTSPVLPPPLLTNNTWSGTSLEHVVTAFERSSGEGTQDDLLLRQRQYYLLVPLQARNVQYVWCLSCSWFIAATCYKHYGIVHGARNPASGRYVCGRSNSSIYSRACYPKTMVRCHTSHVGWIYSGVARDGAYIKIRTTMP